ncbi:MAG: nicotinate-nucleotide diphosphorylase (carboxylating) [Acidobacteria bacterium]|mgnify:CR=1 FL=1|nr:MAG: nicotinate-nucleotide diphosphorylase (carboxylating) [Acidobacteriota bacterium]
MNWNSRRITAILSNALLEDQATRDATTLAAIDPEQKAMATILAKEDCVLAGIGGVQRIFEVFAELEGVSRAYPEVSIPQEVFDGVRLRKGESVACIRHNARVLLSCERIILNLLQHLSGIATIARQYVDAVEGTGVKILDTRKTVPGLRLLEKYAVRCGGGFNHRLDLSDGILVKNNHIDLAGGVRIAIERVLANRRGEQPIEVEVRNMQELEDALKYGAESILLDNMTPAQTREAVARVRREAHSMKIESSGGITLENVRQYAEAGVDYISVGALTHSARAVDLSMRIQSA